MNRLIGLPGCAVAVNDCDLDNVRLWVVYTIYQLADVDMDYGTFPPLNAVRLPGMSPLSTQALIGDAAVVVAEAIDDVFAASKRRENLTLPPFPAIAAANVRHGDAVCTIVARYSDARHLFFAIVYSLEQLKALQQEYFADYPDEVDCIQPTARLPETATPPPFIIAGSLATFFIAGCILTQVLRINFHVALEH